MGAAKPDISSADAFKRSMLAARSVTYPDPVGGGASGIYMLEDLGHTVLEARSGQEALDVFRRQKDIDVVITDQAMPVMTGTQLAEAIRAERRDLPIILATGFAELPPDAGGDLLKLDKPFRQEDLADAISAAMIDGVAKKMADQFFSNFAEAVSPSATAI